MRGAPHLASVAVSVSTTSATGSDGATLSDLGMVDFFDMTESVTDTGVYRGTSRAVPGWWISRPGTYYWQVQASWTEFPPFPALPVSHKGVSPIFTIRIVATTSTPTTSPSSQPSPALTIADARSNLTRVLRKKFGERFKRHRNFKRGCYRLTTQTVRCRVRWDHGQWRYSGAIDMKNDPDDPEGSILYRSTVRRKRLDAAAPTTPPKPAPSRPSSTCDPSYKGACLKPNVSDYDCAGGSGDGPYYVQGPITVVGDDHYGLDSDGDGTACER